MREVPSPDEAAMAREDENMSRLRADLSRAVSRVCPSWMAPDEDDIVQTAVIRVMDAAARREGSDPFPSSYLWRVAYTVTVDEIRRVRRKRETSLDQESAAGVRETPHERPDPERASAGREIGEAIRDCLTRLVRPRRLAVMLYLQEHTVPELSRYLGWSAKKGENLVYRGLSDLRRCLTARGVRP